MKTSFTLILFVSLIGAIALWYFGVQRPAEKRINATPKTIYQITPISPNSPPDIGSVEGHVTVKHGNAADRQSPPEKEDVEIETPAETTDTRITDTLEPSEQEVSDTDPPTHYQQEESEPKPSHEPAESDSAKELIEAARIAREEGARLQKEAYLVLANQLKTLPVEKQAILLEKMKSEFINAKTPWEGTPAFDSREQALSYWQILLEELHAAGYTPPSGYE